MQYCEDDGNNLSNTSMSGELGKTRGRQTYMGIGSGPFSQIDTHTQVAPRNHTQSLRKAIMSTPIILMMRRYANPSH